MIAIAIVLFIIGIGIGILIGHFAIDSERSPGRTCGEGTKLVGQECVKDGPTITCGEGTKITVDQKCASKYTSAYISYLERAWIQNSNMFSNQSGEFESNMSENDFKQEFCVHHEDLDMCGGFHSEFCALHGDFGICKKES